MFLKFSEMWMYSELPQVIERRIVSCGFRFANNCDLMTTFSEGLYEPQIKN